MEPRITILTLGVDDLERSLAFYREGLGLPSNGIVGREFEYGAVAFFELRGGVLHRFPIRMAAHDNSHERLLRCGHKFAGKVILAKPRARRVLIGRIRELPRIAQELLFKKWREPGRAGL